MTLLLAAQLALVGCGGGGGDGSSTTTGGGTGGTGGSGGTTATSYWTMDTHTYVSSGKSAQQTTMVNNRPYTVVTASTEGDTSNGAYSGGNLSLQLVGTGAGTYTVVSDTTVLLNSDPAAKTIYIKSVVGTAVSTGSTFYVATSGQVSVTQDSDGKYHFTAATPIPTSESQVVNGGVAGAPTTMALVVHDVF